MDSMIIKKIDIPNNESSEITLYKIGGERCCYLFICNNESLLIDCCFDNINDILKATNLPIPKKIIHTQVFQEYCLEWKCLPKSEVYVYEKAKEIALVSDEYLHDIQTVWADDYNWDNMVQEKYGIAGCPTQRHPFKSLNVVGTLKEDEAFEWQGLTFTLIPLDGAGKYSVGYYCKEIKAMFTGNLILSGGYLHNFYDVERGYGISDGYYNLIKSLDMVKIFNPKIILPTAGDVINSVSSDIINLKNRLNDFLKNRFAIKYDSTDIIVAKTEKLEFIPTFREIQDGIYQSNSSGNIVLFIDKKGRGIIVDPDHSSWKSIEENFKLFEQNMDMFEKHYGLKSIDYAFLTHYHGDHLRYANYLRDRYNTNVVTNKKVATILKYPDGFCYPCVYPWYNQPLKTVEVDTILNHNQHIMCGDIKVTAIDTVGHCFAHVGYVIEFGDTRCVCTGDTLMYGGGNISVSLPFSYNDTAYPNRDPINGLNEIKKANADLILCGHGMFFYNKNDEVLNNFITAYEKMKDVASELIGERDLQRAMTPPGYDEMREILL